MKIRLLRPFTYQLDARTTVTLPIGEHDVDQSLAEKILRFGRAKLVSGKQAPENKVVEVTENKAGVGGQAKPRGRPRSKPKH